MVAAVVVMLKVGLAVGLVIAWASVLLPPVLRFFGGVGRSDSIGSFRNKMALLGGSSPSRSGAGAVIDLTLRGGGAMAPAAVLSRRQRQAAKKRRRDILVGLLATTGLAFVGAVFLGGLAWATFGVATLLLVGYVALLWQAQQVAIERSQKVSYLQPVKDAPAGEAPARRFDVAR